MDLNTEREIYQQAGVPEYWNVLPGDQLLLVFTLIETGNYGKPTVYTANDQVPIGVLPGLAIELARVCTAL